MLTFHYEAKDRTGKRKRGKIEASSKPAAIVELKRQGLALLSIEQEAKGLLQREIHFGKPVKSKDFIVFLRQLATLIRAGIGIVDSVHILSQQSESKALRKILIEVEADIRKGGQLSEAFAKHPKVFQTMFLSMIRAGEASGSLEIVLDRLATYYEKSHYTKEKIKSAMMYPLTVGILSIAVTMYLLINIVPTFVTMFASFHAELPAMTRMVMSASDSLVRSWYLYIIGIIVVYFIVRIVVNTSYGRYLLDYATLKMPIFGKLLQKGALARMSRTLSTLFSSSVPILQALTIVEDVVGNKIISQAVHESKTSLREGRPLSEPLKRAWVIPPLVSRMIAIGEETGSLDQMLEKVADFYEAEVENAVDKIKTLIEPLMIVMLAAIVGTIVLAIMIPMFEMFGKVR
ncbi:type II secretion system F family protein [Brevibacillus ruminantium]|uniref:Type II secretion system F family protein n=1 Tax=Brevibacillus ruminantium TaxID=2950604 RepID=A0ABY4WBW5_9BACL|nr:type II secretion system F family protein [Brevibacillus ruminantium]USG64670.1 type II secretion system F family protein [Brevibacillus ruminantium]